MNEWRERLGDWRDEVGIVIGGGPSINRLVQIDRLRFYGRIIAVNRALELPLDPDVWLFGDPHIWQWTTQLPKLKGLYERVTQYDGDIITQADAPYDVRARVHVVKPQGGAVLGDIRDGVPVKGRNTGWWGLNWLHCMGCSPIIIVGFDCKGHAYQKREHQGWFHDGYGYSSFGTMNHNYRTWAQDLYYAGLQLKERGVLHYNMSPGGRHITGWIHLNTIDEMIEVLNGNSQAD